MSPSQTPLDWARGVEWLLASSSPRRQDFLRRLGISFRVVPHGLDEEQQVSGIEPRRVASFLARAKAESVQKSFPGNNRPILAADTTVIFQGEVLGQPADAAEALAFYRRLAGQEHQVVSALCVLFRDRSFFREEVATVLFAPWEENLARDYTESGEWRGAAGGYRLQETGELMVSAVHGSPSCVAGLPLRAFYEIIRDITTGGVLSSDTPALG